MLILLMRVLRVLWPSLATSGMMCCSSSCQLEFHLNNSSCLPLSVTDCFINKDDDEVWHDLVNGFKNRQLFDKMMLDAIVPTLANPLPGVQRQAEV